MKKALLLIPLAFLLVACDETNIPQVSNATYKDESKQLEQNQQKINKAVPIPQLGTSQERLNIAKRAELFNSEDKISYIYLVNYGKVMAFYSVRGKVSSLKSYMTPQEKLVNGRGEPCTNHLESQYERGIQYEPCYQVQAPDIDGSYGDNANGIFFFTTEDVYVEWVGDYMMSDQPLKLTTPPELVREIQ